MPLAKPSTPENDYVSDGKGGKRLRRADRISSARKPMGTPRLEFDEDIANIILERIISGTPLTKVCKQPGIPKYIVVMRWAEERPDFGNALDRARTLAADAYASDALAIADESANAEDHVEIGSARIRTDVRLRLAGALNRKYSDKRNVEISGQVQVQVNDTARLKALQHVLMRQKMIDGQTDAVQLIEASNLAKQAVE